MIGDITEQDIIDRDVMDYDAVGRLLGRYLLIIHEEEGHTGEMLVAIALVRLLARLRREGVI